MPQLDRRIAAIVTALFIALPVMAADDETAMFRATPALTGVYQSPAPVSLAGVRFTFRTGGPIRNAPAVSGGAIYFGSADHYFYAVDARTGAQRWRFDAGGGVTSSTTILGGLVYFVTRDNTLYALNAKDGVLKWKDDLGRDLGNKNYWDFYNSSPTPYGSTLYVGGGDGHVRAIDAATGKEEWSYDAQARVRSTPAVTDDLVVFGTMSGHVLALDRHSGMLRWDFATKGASNKFEDKHNDTTSVVDSPTIGDGVVVIGGRDGMIYGIDLATGTQKWRTTHDGSSWILSSAAEDGTVYIGSGSALILQAADIQTGAEKWRFKARSAIFGSPTIAGNVVMFSDLSGTLSAVDRTTGRGLWDFPLGDHGFGTPVISDGIVYAASDSGVLYALDTATTPGRPVPRRLVYWQGAKDPTAAGWFQHGADTALLAYFKSEGYEQVNAVQLEQAMKAQIAQGARSVVVFADGRIPASLVNPQTPDALIRRYVDAGGSIVFPNGDALSLVYDPKTGGLQGIDFDIPEKVMSIHYPSPEIEKGYHISTYTADGERQGLDGAYVAQTAIGADQVDVVLGRNEFGWASSWVKHYGDKGGSVIQLAAPRDSITNLTPYGIAIEESLR